LQGASKSWGVSNVFIGVIIIPVAGNAAEHASAVMFAMKNRMEVSIGVAIGSSIQIAMFVVRAG
jgi:Ca2+:H+ antiporter